MTSIHWHGLILPTDMDGVPGISFGGIAPGETFTYRFVVKQSGTFWYHAHTLAEQTGLYGPMIIESKSETTLARSEEHTAELQSLMRISYAVFCLKKKTSRITNKKTAHSIDE